MTKTDPKYVELRTVGAEILLKSGADVNLKDAHGLNSSYGSCGKWI